MEELLKIHQKWHEVNNCELKSVATQPVFGDGNPKAEIVFIGEAPGKDEDIQGKPFVGRAGQFLNEMLGIIGMERKDVYITNTVKYRPPGNRDPLPEEIKECLPWLIEELNFIKPKVIVMLGRHALNRFFPTEQISKVHGKLLKKKMGQLETENFFALYHPASALYNGSMRDVLIEDFKKLPLVIKNIK
jgi:uracil-DNA glycosylase family 4